jgi:hypothetical protein
MMETVNTSEISVNFYETTRHNISDELTSTIPSEIGNDGDSNIIITIIISQETEGKMGSKTTAWTVSTEPG